MFLAGSSGLARSVTQTSFLLQNFIGEAEKVNNPRLPALAAKVRLDVFTKVKKAIDDMVVQFCKEKEVEITRTSVLRCSIQTSCKP